MAFNLVWAAWRLGDTESFDLGPPDKVHVSSLGGFSGWKKRHWAWSGGFPRSGFQSPDIPPPQKQVLQVHEHVPSRCWRRTGTQTSSTSTGCLRTSTPSTTAGGVRCVRCTTRPTSCPGTSPPPAPPAPPAPPGLLQPPADLPGVSGAFHFSCRQNLIRKRALHWVLTTAF